MRRRRCLNSALLRRPRRIAPRRGRFFCGCPARGRAECLARGGPAWGSVEGPGSIGRRSSRWFAAAPAADGMDAYGFNRPRGQLRAWLAAFVVSQQAPGPVGAGGLQRSRCLNRPRGQLRAWLAAFVVSQQAPGPVGPAAARSSSLYSGTTLIEPFRSKSIVPGPCCVKSTGPFEIDPPGQRMPCRRSMTWPSLPFPDQSAPWISTRPGAR